MKKVVLAVFSLVLAGAVSVQAQVRWPAAPRIPAATAMVTVPAKKAPATEEKIGVRLEELPAAVKSTLASPSLKAWYPTEAFLVKDNNGKEYYAINIKKENEVGSIQIDKNGKPVR